MKKKNAPARSAPKPPVKTNGKTLALPSPKITEKKVKKVTSADLVEVDDTSLMVSIDLKRQQQSDIDDMEINEGQRFFPYNVLPRFMIGWEAVAFISSMEMKLSPEHPLPQITVRFVEKMPAEEVAKLDGAVRAQIDAQITRLRQYPFIKVESPLLTS